MSDDAFDKFGSTHNKQALMYGQKQKTKTCDCGRGKIYTGSNSIYNPVVDGRQVCNECKVDSIYARVKDRLGN